MKRNSVLLRRLGILPTLSGYRYLEYGIMLIQKEPDRMLCVTKELYAVIASRYDTNWMSVEHAIRTAVNVCWDKGNRKLLNELAGYTLRVKPTSSQFIAILAARR